MAKELAEKLAAISKWTLKYPCNSCKAVWDCDDCEKLKIWLKGQQQMPEPEPPTVKSEF